MNEQLIANTDGLTIIFMLPPGPASITHRLMLDISLRHVTAYVNHNNGLKVVQASTKEFCISRYLHKTSDTAAAFNVGCVIALRCKETGLDRVMWEHKWDRKHKKVRVEPCSNFQPRKKIKHPGYYM